MSVDRQGNVVISDDLILALAERGLSFFPVGLRSFSISVVELTPDRQRAMVNEFLPTDTLGDHARKLSEGA